MCVIRKGRLHKDKAAAIFNDNDLHDEMWDHLDMQEIMMEENLPPTYMSFQFRCEGHDSAAG